MPRFIVTVRGWAMSEIEADTSEDAANAAMESPFLHEFEVDEVLDVRDAEDE